MPQKYSKKKSYFSYCTFWSTSQSGSTTTDRKPTDRKQTDREQRRLAEKGYPEFIFTIPRAILPKLSLCDKIILTKSLLHDQLTWLSQSYNTATRVSHCNKITVHEFTLSNNIQSFIHTVQQSANFGILNRSANVVL